MRLTLAVVLAFGSGFLLAISLVPTNSATTIAYACGFGQINAQSAAVKAPPKEEQK